MRPLNFLEFLVDSYYVSHHNMHNIENDTPPLISNLAHGVSNIRISKLRNFRDDVVRSGTDTARRQRKY